MRLVVCIVVSVLRKSFTTRTTTINGALQWSRLLSFNYCCWVSERTRQIDLQVTTNMYNFMASQSKSQSNLFFLSQLVVCYRASAALKFRRWVRTQTNKQSLTNSQSSGTMSFVRRYFCYTKSWISNNRLKSCWILPYWEKSARLCLQLYLSQRERNKSNKTTPFRTKHELSRSLFAFCI